MCFTFSWKRLQLFFISFAFFTFFSQFPRDVYQVYHFSCFFWFFVFLVFFHMFALFFTCFHMFVHLLSFFSGVNISRNWKACFVCLFFTFVVRIIYIFSNDWRLPEVIIVDKARARESLIQFAGSLIWFKRSSCHLKHL